MFIQSFRWTRRCCCCGTRTSSILIFLVYAVLHISLLSITLLIKSPIELLDYLVNVVDTRDGLLGKSDIFMDIKQVLVVVG